MLTFFIHLLVVTIEFSEPVYNASEADGSILVCLAPVTIDTIGFSIPIDVSVSLVNDTVDQEDCSGSGNLSSMLLSEH